MPPSEYASEPGTDEGAAATDRSGGILVATVSIVKNTESCLPLLSSSSMLPMKSAVRFNSGNRGVVFRLELHQSPDGETGLRGARSSCNTPPYLNRSL